MKTFVTKIISVLAACVLAMYSFASCNTSDNAKKEGVVMDRESEIRYNFSEGWTRKGKQMALRTEVPEMYPYVGAEYLLQELLKLECFHYWTEYGSSYGEIEFREYIEDEFQGNYEIFRDQFNDCAEGWNRALQNIALLAAEDEDYATANRCLSEFKPIMKMVSRSYCRTINSGGKLYDFKSELAASPTKEITFNKIQAIKMVKDIEQDFNTANFARGSSQLSDKAKSVLDRLVVLLSKDETLSVKFIGHTSTDGDADFNQQLSKERAKAAAKYIESKGVNFIRIGHEGKGFSELKNKYDPTSEENCRIEIILM